jgi:hypothetical protein
LQKAVFLQAIVQFPDFELRLTMRKLINFLKQNKIVIYIIVLIAAYIVNLFLKPKQIQENVTFSTESPNYNSLETGKSSEADLLKTLGNPISQKDENGTKKLEFKSTNQYRHNEAIIKDGKVIKIKEVVNFGEKQTANDITNKYGKPAYKLYSLEEQSSLNLYVYPSIGLAYLGHDDGTLMEIWYFVPTNINQFMNEWGQGYSKTLPLKTKQPEELY